MSEENTKSWHFVRAERMKYQYGDIGCGTDQVRVVIGVKAEVERQSNGTWLWRLKDKSGRTGIEPDMIEAISAAMKEMEKEWDDERDR